MGLAHSGEVTDLIFSWEVENIVHSIFNGCLIVSKGFKLVSSAFYVRFIVVVILF